MTEQPRSPAYPNASPDAHGDAELAVQQQTPSWDVLQPDFEHRFRRLAAEALKDRPKAGEITLILADDALQQTLNRQYRGIDKSTNVLAFADLDETGGERSGEPAILGDVVLAFETCAREAEAQGKRLEDHALHLALHGLLHLLGYDHDTADEAEAMETVERHLLAKLGIADPYAEVSDPPAALRPEAPLGGRVDG